MEEPWWIITKGMSDSLNAELQKKLSSGHVLYGKEAVAVARREDNDDVVYWVEELNKYAVVHLTYSKESLSKFPVTKLFSLGDLEVYVKISQKFIKQMELV